ncbi:unnamed protein product [Alopecurus aequalis]
MPSVPSKRRKASPSPPPSEEASSDSGSDSDLHLHDDHSDPEDDGGFFSARSAAVDDEQDSDDDEHDSDEEEDEDDDGKMGELEQEYRTLQANQQSILETLKQHRDDDVARGQAVKNQKALWDKTLEMRFLLQKAFSASNKLPKDSVKSRFCSHDEEVEQAYVELLDSSKQTLGCMLELQEALLERNQAAKGLKNDKLPDSNGENDEWLEVQKVQTRITPFRNTEIDKWQRKTQVTTGAAALKGKLHAFNQNISDQVAGYMRDPSRMINRMYLRKSDVGVFGESASAPVVTVEGKTVEGDPELVDDSEFYHQLLKEFLESCDGASESAFYALRKKQHKKRKLVDRRASKSRKIRYNVHEKLANFMAPVPMTVPPMASKLFENLFGVGNQKPTAA